MVSTREQDRDSIGSTSDQLYWFRRKTFLGVWWGVMSFIIIVAVVGFYRYGLLTP